MPKTSRWTVHFEFNCQGDPPRVHFRFNDGWDLIEVHEAPLLRSGGDPEDNTAWSWEPADWKLGPRGEYLLEVLQLHGGAVPSRD